jgi:hypothetical protein
MRTLFFKNKWTIKKVAVCSIGCLISIGCYVHYTYNKTNNNVTINNQETKITTISSRKQAKSKHHNNKIVFTAGNITNSNIEVGNCYATNSASTHKEGQSTSESDIQGNSESPSGASMSN